MAIYKYERELDKMRLINSSVNYEIANANKFFYQEDLPVRECMRKLLDKELVSADFRNNPYDSKEMINKWISNQTRYQINDFLSDDNVHEDTKLILVSYPMVDYNLYVHE